MVAYAADVLALTGGPEDRRVVRGELADEVGQGSARGAVGEADVRAGEVGGVGRRVAVRHGQGHGVHGHRAGDRAGGGVRRTVRQQVDALFGGGARRRGVRTRPGEGHEVAGGQTAQPAHHRRVLAVHHHVHVQGRGVAVEGGDGVHPPARVGLAGHLADRVTGVRDRQTHRQVGGLPGGVVGDAGDVAGDPHQPRVARGHRGDLHGQFAQAPGVLLAAEDRGHDLFVGAGCGAVVHAAPFRGCHRLLK